MTYKEAIKHFRSLQKRYTTEHNGKMCEKVALALEAMEKQVPKKPIIFITDRYDYPEEAYRCSICDSNGNLYKGEYLYKGQRYCDECGNAVDWSDVK